MPGTSPTTRLDAAEMAVVKALLLGQPLRGYADSSPEYVAKWLSQWSAMDLSDTTEEDPVMRGYVDYLLEFNIP